jgi:ribosomal protein S18 acetylase RimI-like enzyme
MDTAERRSTIALTIRPIAAGDIPLIDTLMPRRMPGTHRERMEKQERGEALYLVAWLDVRPVGHLLLRWDGSASSPGASTTWPTFSDISVPADLRSRGIGSQLMEHAERLVAQRGYRQVGLSVALDNPRARALYERRGYRDSGLGTHNSRWPYLDEQDRECWHQETCVRLVKQLADQI